MRGRGVLSATDITPRLIVDRTGKLLWPQSYPALPQPASETNAEESLSGRNSQSAACESGALRVQAGKSKEAVYAAASELASNAVSFRRFDAEVSGRGQTGWVGTAPGGTESKVAWWRGYWWGEEETRAMYDHLVEQNELEVALRSPLLDSMARAFPADYAERLRHLYQPRWQRSSCGWNSIYPQVLVELALLELLDQARLTRRVTRGVF